MNVVDQNGFLQRRSRFLADGREVIIIDNRRRGPSAGAIAAGIGIGIGIGALMVHMPPPIIHIPRERYIVDYGMAPPGYIYDALIAPPIEVIERPYSLDEIRYSAPLRDRMPRVDLNTVTFETGSWELTPDQIEKLAVIADGLNRAIAQNPGEVYLIEGSHRRDWQRRRQSFVVRPPRGIRRHRADPAVQRAGGKPDDPGLWRTISADPDARAGTRQPPRRRPPRDAAPERARPAGTATSWSAAITGNRCCQYRGSSAFPALPPGPGSSI